MTDEINLPGTIRKEYHPQSDPGGYTLWLKTHVFGLESWLVVWSTCPGNTGFSTPVGTPTANRVQEFPMVTYIPGTPADEENVRRIREYYTYT